jgi:hypothetical protein
MTHAFALAAVLATQSVDFNRDVRPILANHCFKCHGLDALDRKAGLRLDSRETATAAVKSGRRPIVPGKPDQSEMIRRIFADDEDERMPPVAVNNPLTDAQRGTLRRWIAEGAVYAPHWAFVPPRQAPLPPVRRREWPRNPIDRFVLAGLEAAELAPSPEADRYTLVRRVSLDLIGLPPTPEEADAFARDSAPDAYEKLVDRLLASPHYGERWARPWLDLARYADTNGYEKDRARSIWPYRDWVIRALNDDLPFDRFTIEQIAGDMLPGATLDQRIATGFHRNTMLNEEGGIDPLEFRYHAVVDRVNTTAVTWLGLTFGCAQCHTHKFDPIPQRDYYRMMAFLNNADEPELEVPQPDVAARRAEIQRQIDALEAALPEQFPPGGELRWTPGKILLLRSSKGATVESLDDGSVRLGGPAPDKDVYQIALEAPRAEVAAMRIEALTDDALPKRGPGRAPNGNFVLGEVKLSYRPPGAQDDRRLKFSSAESDVAQSGFPAADAIDENPKTGWAVDVGAGLNADHAAVFYLEAPVAAEPEARWTLRLEQNYGGAHTLGRLRISFGSFAEEGRTLEERRRDHLERSFARWRAEQEAKAVAWTVVRPTAAVSGLPRLTVLDDGSILAGGDQSKSDTYDLEFPAAPAGVTALRLEVLPDERLPRRGPGRVFYEGPAGDFFLSELTVQVGSVPLKLQGATQTFAAGGKGAAAAIDGDPQTGWSIDGGQGGAHEAVFRLAEPAPAGPLEVRMLFERYYAAGLGRFRLSVTTDPRAAEAGAPVPGETAESLRRRFLATARELGAARAKIESLRRSMPSFPTTLVMSERPPNHPRPTFMHKRGEFLQPTEQVEPGLPSIFAPPAAGPPRDRLSFARWLVDSKNPLVGRVVMNRHWAALFGRGLVRTSEDFGVRGEAPSHPELLDWLAVELVGRRWSIKQMHRLIVTSATYRQSSARSSESAAKDPDGALLSRYPRARMEAELVRDSLLRAAGLLSTKIGGPSVFPPQPPGVSSEGAYGPLEWKVSQGEDRYRRGLYTYSKRTAPYAMFTTFDAPSGEACTARRDRSNTPLQALMLLNDEVVNEAARALGRRVASMPPEGRIGELFRLVLTRPPEPDELEALGAFAERQRERFGADAASARALAGDGGPEAAALTATARVLLNVDEAVVKE